MRERILKQTGICLLIVLTLLAAKQSGIGFMERGAQMVVSQLRTEYTMEDLKQAAGRGEDALAALSDRFGGALEAMTQQPALEEPIDRAWKGGKTGVHAVAAGQVAAVGENEEIGIYVRIVHDNMGESLYGNLQSACVKVPQKVKRGELIGIFAGEDPSNFYYSFQKFK